MEVEFKNKFLSLEDTDSSSVIVIKIYKLVVFCIEYQPGDYFAIGAFNFGLVISF